MNLSMFVLALYVFLESVPAFKWFSVDPKFTAFVGIAFVVVVMIETLWHPIVWHRGDKNA